jgi:hypothetical protein
LHYRAAAWKHAIDALEQSMDLRSGADARDWLFLAMARWQLGDRNQARNWCDKAVAPIEKNKPKDDDLFRFRAEATALLGLRDERNPGRNEWTTKPSR